MERHQAATSSTVTIGTTPTKPERQDGLGAEARLTRVGLALLHEGYLSLMLSANALEHLAQVNSTAFADERDRFVKPA